MKHLPIYWICLALVGLSVVSLLIWPESSWLPRIRLTLSDLGMNTSPPPHFLQGQDDLARRMYEIASIASYSVVVTLTMLSLTVPLLLLYFGQVVDGIQSVLKAVFDEMRPYRERGDQLPQELRDLYNQCLEKLAEAEKSATLLRPIFRMVFLLAVGLLVLLFLFHLFAARSILLYAFAIRAFSSSILLGIVGILVLGYLASKRFSYERIVLLNRLAVVLDPVQSASSFGKGASSTASHRFE